LLGNLENLRWLLMGILLAACKGVEGGQSTRLELNTSPSIIRN
jgi:hypothetical protein